MVDVDLVEQLVKTIEEAVNKLEEAHRANDLNYINRLRVFIFNVHQQIDEHLGGGK